MIIKSIDITAFGVIKNYHLEFTKGINLIYGENEAGKSTIQNFIKIWLYGFANYHGKNLLYHERLKYTPLSGEKIKGVLTFEINQREYMIIRSFGKAKRDDEIKIIDALTGDNLNDIYGDKPGEKLLGVNRATFIKTLFIGQLSVEIKPDKDENIINKMVSFTGSNENEITIEKSFEKINQYIKSITNLRRSGTLDTFRERRGSLEMEKMEFYKIHETNLNQEAKLITTRKTRNLLKKKANNLLLYKQYLKTEELKDKYNNLKSKEMEYGKYKDKINELQKEITNLSYEKQNLEKNIVNFAFFESPTNNFKNTFINYENKLNELKELYSQNQILIYRKKYLLIFILLINLLLILIFKSIIINLILNLCLISFYGYDKFLNKKSLSYKFFKVSTEVQNIEKTLANLKENLGATDYEDLFKKINLYYKSQASIQAIETKIAQFTHNIELLQLKLQTVESLPETKEKAYLAEKITTFNLDYTKLLVDKDFKIFNETINLNSNFNKLTFLEKQEQIEQKITTNNSQLLNCEKEILALESNIKNSFYGKRPLAEIEEDIMNTDYSIDDLRKKLKAGELAREIMKKTYLSMRDDFSPELNHKLLAKYNALCQKNYDNILVSDEYAISLIKDNSILDYNLLSNGSKDQLFLALRLSFIEMIFNNTNIPLFLDDAFVQYDDKKLKSALFFLLKENFEQQFIFTCHTREKKILEDFKASFNYIQLP